MEKEIWKDIPNYENHYMASNFGRIKSIKRKDHLILKQNGEKNRYLYVNLSKPKDNGFKTFSVHKLILLTFVGECPAKQQRMHLDSDPTNNYASNLRYGSAMCNNAFKIDNGTNAKHGNHGYSKLTLFQVKRIKEFLFIGISQLEISKMFKVSRRNINRIANNVIWQK